MWIDDDVLRRCREDLAIALWVPQQPMVVLGSSNRAEVEADEERCALEGVQVLKRYGGGGTVVLHSGCVVLSIGCWVAQPFQNGLYFDGLNRAVIAALQVSWPQLALGQNGLSDLSYRLGAAERKVAGTSLFRSRNYLLYQASILVDSGLELIERYLRHPSREPDYRGGRSHRQFVVGLNEVVPGLTPEACRDTLAAHLPAALQSTLGAELIAARPEQWDGLLRRAGP